MFVKLCGFTRIEDIKKVKDLPVSAVGFIFYKNSRRYVSPDMAAEMALLLEGSDILKTGIFVDDEPESIMSIVNHAGLDMIQVYNSNTANELSSKIPVITCARVGGPDHKALPEPQHGGMILFDTYSPEFHGGTGKSFNLNLIKDYPFRDRMIIAGGINENNIKKIIKQLRPGGIDISSGIEISPGLKCEDKISKIMRLIQEAEND